MAVLYQKYRPQNFSQIFGQNHIKTTLQNEILNNKVSHAYLFCGPRAVGKTTLARVLAKAVNCEERNPKDFEPCNKCSSCSSIINFSNLDVIEVDAASNTGVDNVRDNIISLSRVKSSNNKFKVFIIDEVHMLSLSAFNALLKTLEEPPQNVIFILCTTEIYKVPTTIISRCERFDFKRISFNDMVAKLEVIVKNEGLDVDREVLNLISLKSDGHLRDAESLLSQIIAISDKKIDLASANLVIPYNSIEENIFLLESLGKKDIQSAIQTVNNLVDSGINLKNFLNDLIELLRKMILSKVSDSLSSSLGLDLSEKLEIKISELNSNFSLNSLVQITEEFMGVLKNLSGSLIPQMLLELAIINICQPSANNIDNTNSSFTSTNSQTPIRKAKETPPINNNPKSQNNLDPIITKEELDKNWPEVITKLKPFNHSLSFVLQSCKIDSINGNKICLNFKYKFHKDRLDKPEIRSMVAQVLKDVFKADLIIDTGVDENMEINLNNKNNDLINDLLKTFGGQVIN